MRNSPFAIFRKHQKVLMVVVTLLAMFAFVILDALPQSGEIPLLLMALIGAAVGAGIFWLLGSSGGKGTEWAIGGALLGVVAVVLWPRFFGEAGAVSSSVGSLSEEELFDLRRRRRTANQLVRDVYAVGNPFPERMGDISPELADMEGTDFGRRILSMQQQQWSIGLSRYQFRPLEFRFEPLSEQAIVETWLLTHEADEMGIAISDAAVTDYLKQVSNGKLRGQDLTRLRKEYGLSESQLYDILRYELKAAAARGLSVPPLLTTPEDLWDLHRQFNVRQELTLTAVPVERFVDKDQQPSRAELTEFFEKYKEQPPAAGEPGFLQPRKIQLAYLEADYETARIKLFPEPITDEQLREHYDSHREEFRNPLYKPEQPQTPLSGPAIAPPGASAPAAGGTAQTPAATNGGPAQPPAGPPTIAPSAPAATPAPSGERPSDSSPPGDGQASRPRTDELVEVAFLGQDEPAATEPGGTAQPEPAAGQPAPAASQADSPAADLARPAAAAPGAAASAPASSAAASSARHRPLPPPLPENPVTEYLSFDEARDRILSQLEQERDERVRQDLDRLMSRADDRMHELARAYKAPADDADKLTAAQVSSELQKFAKEHDLRYVATELLSYEELSRETVGQMTDVNASPFDSPPLADLIFNSGPDTVYIRIQARDPATGNRIIGWKTQDVASHVPQFTDVGIEARVLEAWRLAQARPKAQERAEALAQLVREHPDKDMQQALAGQTITGAEGSLELTVRNTRSFTWLRQSTAPEPGQLGGTRFEGLSEIDGVENAGNDFMETIFNDLNEGDVGVVPNADKSVSYVVKVVNRSSASETGRKILYDELLRAPFFEGRSPYPELLGSLQQQLGMAWVQRLTEKYDVQWNRPVNDDLRGEL